MGSQSSKKKKEDLKPYFANDPRVLNSNLNTVEGQSKPTNIKCAFCEQFGVTRVQNKIGKGTILASLIILVLFCPLFWLPCCLEKCQDKVHYCQNCGQIVGIKFYELC